MIEEFVGQTIVDIKMNETETELTFTMSSGVTYVQYHQQDCCENVWVEDIAGDLNDLKYSTILDAREEINNETSEYDDSTTWTFYILRTMKGSVTIRWCGASNGYYSESVDWIKNPPAEGFRANMFEEDLFTLH